MPGSGHPIGFGVFEVDLHTGELRKQGVRIKLREQPFQILVLLLAHAGDVVSRDELQKQLWPSRTFGDFDRGLNKAVNHLREALGDSAESPRFIETLPKHGYRFIAPVDAGRLNGHALEPALAIERAPAEEPDRSALGGAARPLELKLWAMAPWMVAGLSLAAAAILAALLWRTGRAPDRP